MTEISMYDLATLIWLDEVMDITLKGSSMIIVFVNYYNVIIAYLYEGLGTQLFQ